MWDPFYNIPVLKQVKWRFKCKSSSKSALAGSKWKPACVHRCLKSTNITSHSYHSKIWIAQILYVLYNQTNVQTQLNRIRPTPTNIVWSMSSNSFQVSKLSVSEIYAALFSFIWIHYRIYYILRPTPQHQQQCVLLQLYHTIIPIVVIGTQFSASADFTVCPQSFNSQKQAGFISEKKNDI